MIEDRADEMKSLETIPGLRSILDIEFDAGGSGGDELEDGRVEGRREERRSEDVQPFRVRPWNEGPDGEKLDVEREDEAMGVEDWEVVVGEPLVREEGEGSDSIEGEGSVDLC